MHLAARQTAGFSYIDGSHASVLGSCADFGPPRGSQLAVAFAPHWEVVSSGRTLVFLLFKV